MRALAAAGRRGRVRVGHGSRIRQPARHDPSALAAGAAVRALHHARALRQRARAGAVRRQALELQRRPARADLPSRRAACAGTTARRRPSRDVAFTLLAARDPRTGYCARRRPRRARHGASRRRLARRCCAFAPPLPAFPLVLCELPILPAHLLARRAARATCGARAFNLAPVGNGPFRFVERVAGQRWVFRAQRRLSRGARRPAAIAELVIAVVDEPTTKFAGLASGDLDFAGIAPTMAALAQRDPTIRVLDYPVLLATGLLFNTHRAPFDDVRVRRAVDLSIDRERIVQAALAGYGTPPAGPVAPESPFALARDDRRKTRAPPIRCSTPPAGARAADGDARARRQAARRRTAHRRQRRPGGGAAVQADLAARGIRMEIRVWSSAHFSREARAVPRPSILLLTGIPGRPLARLPRAMYDGRQRGSALDYAGLPHAARSIRSSRARAPATTRASASPPGSGVQAELARDVPAAWIYHSRGLQGSRAGCRTCAWTCAANSRRSRSWTVAARAGERADDAPARSPHAWTRDARRPPPAGRSPPLADSIAADLDLLHEPRAVRAAREGAALARRRPLRSTTARSSSSTRTRPTSIAARAAGRVHAASFTTAAGSTGISSGSPSAACTRRCSALLRGDARHGALARDIARRYCAMYASYPNRDNVLGPTRLFFSTYLESIWLLQLCVTADLLAAGNPAERPRARTDRRAERALIAQYDEGCPTARSGTTPR